MQELKEKLDENIQKTEEICLLIEKGDTYIELLKKYLLTMNEMITCITEYSQASNGTLRLNDSFVMQVLRDIIDGIERNDSVILLDTLRYGWLEILNYIMEELQGGNIYE